METSTESPWDGHGNNPHKEVWRMKAEITSMHTTTNTNTLPTCCWNDINEPGCYVFADGNCLARVPNDGVAEGRSPKITFYSTTNPTVWKISSDPYTSVSKARQICADHDIPVNF
jgi:hypothetical protein